MMDFSSTSLPAPSLVDSESFAIDLGSLDQTHSLDVLSTKRRSSSRSIKRRRFDDELVESSLGTAATFGPKIARSRTQSLSSPGFDIGLQSTLSSSSQIPSTSVPADRQKRASNKPGSSGRRNRRSRHAHAAATKDLGRWKPTDDLALIIGIQQTNDIKSVHQGTKFSCKFTLQELQQRWYALLYDPAVSRVAVAAMRNLHPEIIASVRSRALFSIEEENLLMTIKSTSNPTLETFQELLQQNAHTMYPARTAKSLMNHWLLMKQFYLLPDQTIPSLQKGEFGYFSDAEEHITRKQANTETTDMEEDYQLTEEMKLTERENKRGIRRLENEIGRWQVLVDSVTGISPPDFDNQTLAVLRGRLVRYLMRSREITVGRSTKDQTVDVDLSLEGPAWKISRRQGTIRLRNNGDFFLASEGKRPIFVDGRPILAGNKYRLNNNSVVEIAGLRFIFLINQDLISVIRQEAAKMNLQP